MAPAAWAFDLRAAARGVRRHPWFSLAVAGTLALALGVLSATLAVVHGVLLRPLPFRDPAQLVLICERHPSVRDYCVGSPPNAADWSLRSRALASVGLARDWPFVLRRAEGQASVRGGLASDAVFGTFDVRPILGRTFTPADLGPVSRVVLLSHAYWQTAFAADSTVVGRGITIDDSTWTIIGVLGPDARIPTLEAVQLWAPLPFPLAEPSQRGWRGFSVFARLRHGVSRSRATAELRQAARDLATEYPETNSGWDVEVRSVHAQLVGEARPLLLVFLTATGLVLLVAAANIANLMLARSTARSRELAVQAAVGGGRERMVRSLLFESLLLAASGTAVALVIAQGALTRFLRLAPAGVPRLDGVAIGWGLVLMTAALGAAVAFGAGLPPLLRATRMDLSTALRAGGADAGAASGRRTRSALVVAQVAMAVTLLAGAGLLLRTFANLLHWRPGFDTDHLMVAWTSVSSGRYPDGRTVTALHREIRTAVAAIPGVVGVGNVSNGPLFGGDEPGSFRSGGGPGARVLTARWYDASDGYHEGLGLTISRGRSIAATDRAGAPPVAVVNETFARRMWPGQDPLGQRVAPDQPGATAREVVGVVRDVPPFRTGDPVVPEIWWPYDQAPRWGTFLVVRTAGPPAQWADAVGDAVQAAAPAVQLGRWRPMRELIEQQLATPRFSLALVAGFAGPALVMAVIGLYGLVSSVAGLRQRELAIRAALGASHRAVRREVLRQGAGLAAWGIGLGAVGAAAIGRVLRSLLAGVGAFDPITLVAVAGLLACCTVGATLAPAWRASRADPMAALRAE